MTANSGPGYAKHPEHRIITYPANARVQVYFRGEVVADSRDAVALKEASYPVVYYLPRSDVRMDRLVRSTHSKYCPFKGHAAYFSLADGAENAVWSYERPHDEVAVIRELLAFYPDKVGSIVVGKH